MLELRPVITDDEPRICPTTVPEDRLIERRIGGFWCVLARVDTRVFAYREVCPGCGSSLVHSPVTAAVVTCSICRRRYDLTRGGRSLDTDVHHLRAVPVVGEPIPRSDPWDRASTT